MYVNESVETFLVREWIIYVYLMNELYLVKIQLKSRLTPTVRDPEYVYIVILTTIDSVISQSSNTIFISDKAK